MENLKASGNIILALRRGTLLKCAVVSVSRFLQPIARNRFRHRNDVQSSNVNASNNLAALMKSSPDLDTSISSASVWNVTDWKTVNDAVDSNTPEAVEAIGRLYQYYKRPITVTVKSFFSQVPGIRDDWEDIAQEFFFSRFNASELMRARTVCAQKSLRLRQYLRTALRTFLLDRRRYWKVRGMIVPSNGSDLLEALDEETSDRTFDRECAMTLIVEAIADVTEKYAAQGKEEDIRNLLPWIHHDDGVRLSEVARIMCIGEGAVRSRIHRLKADVRHTILKRIRNTLLNPTDAEVEAERLDLMRLSQL